MFRIGRHFNVSIIYIFINPSTDSRLLCFPVNFCSSVMASASSSSARNLFADSKSRINQRVQYSVDSKENNFDKVLVKGIMYKCLMWVFRYWVSG